MSHKHMTIFAPDNQTPAGIIKFAKYLDEVGVSEYVKELVGCYRGETEKSFIMASEWFDLHVRETHFVAGQESFLHVTGCNKAYATLEYTDARLDEALGSMCEVSKDVAMREESWTYRPDTNNYFICRKINPDHARNIT